MSFAPHAPTVETPDLILRGYQEGDFEAFAAFGTSERARHVGGPHTRWESWRAFMAGVGHWVMRGYGMWIIEHRETETVAGRVGILMNDGWAEPELGWHIYDGFEGKSLAYQACLAARGYAAQHFGLNGVISYIHADNTRSIALAHRLGAFFECETSVLGQDCFLYRHPQEILSKPAPLDTKGTPDD